MKYVITLFVGLVAATLGGYGTLVRFQDHGRAQYDRGYREGQKQQRDQIASYLRASNVYVGPPLNLSNSGPAIINGCLFIITPPDSSAINFQGTGPTHISDCQFQLSQ